MSARNRFVGPLTRVVSRAVRAGAITAVVLAVTGCGGTQPTTAGAELHVYAAASLRKPFEDIAREFESVHPGTTVQLNLAGSSELATQIIAGAPADVFASADQSTMARVADEGLVAAPARAFATNFLTIAVAPGNPLGIDSLKSLTDPDIAVVLCAEQVPCGAAAARAQNAAGVDIQPVSEEASVTDVLGKIRSGQADAGLVYVTDVAAALDSVDGVPFDEAADAVNVYPIASTPSGGTRADEFVDFTLGPQGRKILAEAGFGAP
ncbi:molybdate ABC transporter substrate-binding protein [Arthrobacter sp. JZ12]|uniref:molybdate ABC transporter substrate-binding protein n=1 Tax=Arthrobacter sp. JZ12 TaxID=2654190 RepID=UPI002B482977|nr:molybdate ABC transporter substrate-binding protein [Arthrobacter sp. JZ12]